MTRMKAVMRRLQMSHAHTTDQRDGFRCTVVAQVFIRGSQDNHSQQSYQSLGEK
jgi:hypothetical protein